MKDEEIMKKFNETFSDEHVTKKKKQEDVPPYKVSKNRNVLPSKMDIPTSNNKDIPTLTDNENDEKKDSDEEVNVENDEEQDEKKGIDLSFIKNPIYQLILAIIALIIVIIIVTPSIYEFITNL